jgi:putative NADH-flavin reductase
MRALRILVLGASGRTGRLVVEQALGHGHEVVALVRDAARLVVSDPRLTVIVGEVTVAADVAKAVDGCDAVISALGAGPVRPVHVYSDGVANAIRAMSARGIRRLVVVTAQSVGARPEEMSLKARAMHALPSSRQVYEDMERMEGDVMLSDLDWTIVRPAALTDGEQTGHYRVVEGAVVPEGKRISRADLAALLVKCAESDRYVRGTVSVAY